MTLPTSQIELILAAAVEIPTEAERQAYVAEACAGDTELQRQVEKMLENYYQAGSFLESPAPGLPATIAMPMETAGQKVGHFTLLEKLGEGGMGTVWIAERDKPIRQRVALKLIKPGMDSVSVLKRFNAERQALALMSHNNIAKMLDAGTTETGRPFFVMELVKGVPITKYCDQVHSTVEERLRLFIPVCQAVQHAHQKGIIHRDIKPSNVLVCMEDGKPVPKVIDFGVAKALHQPITDGTLHTGFNQLVGTLEYMSPEQAELNALDIDTRADIYALGVLLFELLTGSTPVTRDELRQVAMVGMLRKLKEVEPKKPSTRLSESKETIASLAAMRRTDPAKLMKDVRGDLDWIVLKCLEADRLRRYETADALLRDVERHLTDQPVEARAPSRRYRIWKFIWRNRLVVAAASLIVVLFISGSIGTMMGLFWAMNERDVKIKALSSEREAREQTLTTLRDLTDEIIEKQMTRSMTLTEENKQFLKRIIKRYEELADITTDDLFSRSIRGEGYQRIGQMQHRLREANEAESSFRKAIAIRKQLVEDFPNRPELRAALGGSYNNLGMLLHTTRGQFKESEDLYRTALTIQQKLIDDHPGNPEFQEAQGRALQNLGNLFLDTNRIAESEEAYTNAITIRNQLASEFPNIARYRYDLALNLNRLGVQFNYYANDERIKKALDVYEIARDILRKLVKDFPTNSEYREALAGICNNLAILFKNNRPVDAELALTEAITIWKPLAEEFPMRFRRSLAEAHHNLGILLVGLDRMKEAESAHLITVELYRKLVTELPDQIDYQNDLAGALLYFAMLHNKRQDYHSAKEILTEANPHHDAVLKFNSKHPIFRSFYQGHLHALIVTHAGLQDHAGAHQLAQKARDLGWDPPNDAYEAACALASCIPIAEKQAAFHQLNNQTKRTIQIYTDEAMKMLHEATSKGWKDFERLKNDAKLKPLHKREDFQKLLKQIERAT